MKTLLTANITATAEMPIKQGTLNFLQTAHKETNDVLATALIGKAYNNVSQWAIKGVKNTGVFPAYNISAGWIMYNGTMYQVDTAAFNPGFANTAVASIVTTYQTAANADPVEFTDGNPHNVHEIKKIAFATGASGSGLFDYADLEFCEIEDSTDVTYGALWDSGAGGVKARYRKNRDGQVLIEGLASANGTPGIADTVFTLPAGYRPPTDLYMPLTAYDGSTFYAGWLRIETNGIVTAFSAIGTNFANDDLIFFGHAFYNF